MLSAIVALSIWENNKYSIRSSTHVWMRVLHSYNIIFYYLVTRKTPYGIIHYKSVTVLLCSLVVRVVNEAYIIFATKWSFYFRSVKYFFVHTCPYLERPHFVSIYNNDKQLRVYHKNEKWLLFDISSWKNSKMYLYNINEIHNVYIVFS